MRINQECCTVLLALGSIAASGCGNATDPAAVGEIRVSVTTSGPEPDRNGYRVLVDGANSRSLSVDDSTIFQQVTPGSHGIELIDVADNCTVSGGPPRSVTVAAGARERVLFEVSCVATATLRVVTRSTGAPADLDGYQLVVSGRETRPIGVNQSITIPGMAAGSLAVELTGLVPGCVLSGDWRRQVTLVLGDTTEVTFEVQCAPPPPTYGRVQVSVSTNVVNASLPAGYVISLDGGRSANVDANGTVTFAQVLAGTHSVRLSGTPSYCAVGGFFPGPNPVSVRVKSDSVSRVSFQVLCLG